MTTLAHISDVHLAPLPQVSMRELMSKRITGWLNWRLRRARYMQTETMAGLVAHLKAHAPDFIAVTGDLVNLAAVREFETTAHWLKQLGPPDRVCAIPGNHDAYVRGGLETAIREWGDYMRGETLDDAGFPFIRHVGDLAVIGCSSAMPQPPFVASGRIDNAQLDRLARMLRRMAEDNRFRVVLIHHPPSREWGHSRRNRLHGAEAMREVLKGEGAELVLHGHLHKASLTTLPGPSGDIPVVGVTAASSHAAKGEQPARYNLFDIARRGDAWSCVLREYGYQRIGDEIALRLEQRLH